MRTVAGLLVAAVAAWPANAAPKSIFVLRSPAIQASALIDDQIASYPKLRVAILDDARHALIDDRAQAENERQSNPRYFRRWSVDRGYALRAAAGPFVSLLVTDFNDAGGAHPDTILSTLLWNKSTERMVGLEALMIDPANGGPTLDQLAHLIREALAAEKAERGVKVEAGRANDPGLARVEPNIEAIGAPSLTPSTEPGKASGMTFHFSAGDVGARVEGSYVAYIPWQKLQPLLLPQTRALFGGSRPDSDAER
jgi:hypothetical protein